MKPFIGELSALMTACLWGASSLIFAVAASQIGPIRVNINRMILAIGWLLLSLAVFRLPLDLSYGQIEFLALSGISELVIGDSCMYKAFQLIGARLTMVIMSIGPAVNALLAYIFLQEVLSGWGIVGILITLCGILLVVTERSPAQETILKSGVVFACLAALGQGGGILLAKKAFAVGPIHGIVAALIRMSAGLIFLLPPMILAGRYSQPLATLLQKKKVIRLLLAGSFLGAFLGVTLSQVAVANTKVGVASTLLAMPPVMMLPMIKILKKDSLSWKAIVGACIAVSGVAILFLT